MKGLRIITVRGTITAIGTATDSISFSHQNIQVQWQGIRLLKREQAPGKSDSSYIKYCTLVSTLCVDTDSLYMKRGGALYCGPGNYIELSNSFIFKNEGSQGGAVYVDSGSTVRIDNCHFSTNTATIYGGGAIMTSNKGLTDLLVQNCRFEYNHARAGGAVRIGKGTIATFNNCVFYRDTTHSINPDLGDLNGGALAVFGPADVTLRGCIITHCTSYLKGGGIYSTDASLKLINCTIAANSSIYGGGIYFARKSGSSSPLLVNTIVDGNGTLFSVKTSCDSAGCGLFLDSSVTPVFRHCQLSDTVFDHTIKRYTGEFTNSIFERSDFAYRVERNYLDTLPEGYQLHYKDPAVNGGTPDTTGLGLPEFDILGQKRIYGTAVDIGALEYNGKLLPASSLFPFKKQQPFRYGHCDMVIYSLRGQKLGSFNANVTPKTIQQFVGKKFPNGIYLVTLKSSGRQVWSKSVFVK